MAMSAKTELCTRKRNAQCSTYISPATLASGRLSTRGAMLPSTSAMFLNSAGVPSLCGSCV
jgi:hypothetical protein